MATAVANQVQSVRFGGGPSGSGVTLTISGGSGPSTTASSPGNNVLNRRPASTVFRFPSTPSSVSLLSLSILK
nr:unnamed protein product [Haemonchus contortus]